MCSRPRPAVLESDQCGGIEEAEDGHNGAARFRAGAGNCLAGPGEQVSGWNNSCPLLSHKFNNSDPLLCARFLSWSIVAQLPLLPIARLAETLSHKLDSVSVSERAS